MKKLVLTSAIAMVAFCLPAPVVLTISPAGYSNVQIVASVPNEPARYQWVLQSTTNFSDWTPVATNLSAGGTFTNIVPNTNPMTFYRVKFEGP